MGKKIVILGGGWGGLAVAHRLRAHLGKEHHVVVVEKKDTFSMGPSNLWVMTGDRQYPRDVVRPMTGLIRKDIEWVQAEVTAIEAETKKVHTSKGTINADYLVIAMGAESYPDGVPGFSENAHTFYDMESAARLHEALLQFRGGEIVLFCSSMPFRCPLAPSEAALSLEALLRNRGLKDKTQIHLYTPEGQPMPLSGPKNGATLRQMIEDRGIKYHPKHKVLRIDGDSQKIVFEDGTNAGYDLLIGVPPHRAPRVVVDAGLTDATGYIPTHPQTLNILADVETLETKLPGIYAMGDITSITLLNSMKLAKAGVFAEEQASIVAANIASLIHGEKADHIFSGKAICYMETGDGKAAVIPGEYYAYPEPRVVIEATTAEGHRAKEEFERPLTTWFENKDAENAERRERRRKNDEDGLMESVGAC